MVIMIIMIIMVIMIMNHDDHHEHDDNDDHDDDDYYYHSHDDDDDDDDFLLCLKSLIELVTPKPLSKRLHDWTACHMSPHRNLPADRFVHAVPSCLGS